MTVAGISALLVSGSGGLQERLTPFAAVHDETDWTLANGKIAEEGEVDWILANENVYVEKVDWTLAINDSQDTNEE